MKMTSVRTLMLLLAAPMFVGVAQAEDLTTGGNVRSRYLVNLAKGLGDTALPGSIVPTGLFDYASAGGNGAPWFYMNNGAVNPLDPGPGSSNTFGGTSPDFFGYRFKMEVDSVNQIDFFNTTYADAGTFAATPQVQYLDAVNGTWQNVNNVTWNTPYNTDFAPGDEIREYHITIDPPITNAWGIRLHGDANGAGAPEDDPDGYVGVAELRIQGEFTPGSLDLSNNLAAAGPGVTPIASTARPDLPNLLDGNVATGTNNWDPTLLREEDYLGVLWSAPEEHVAGLGVVFKRFGDGGLFDLCNGDFRIEYTTDTTTWVPVTGLDKGRFPADWSYLMQMRWDVETGYLFTFDPTPAIMGIRIIGDPAGYSQDFDGFLAAHLLQVFANTAP